MVWENIIKSAFQVKTNFPDADFWLIRVHDRETVGKPVKEFKPQYIGIKILATDKFDAGYMFYWFMNLHQNMRYWQQVSYSSDGRSSIRVSDVKDLVKRIVTE